ncbi:hypothetical protein N0B44_09945 [Roseibacterium beibuensis]|uniref:hypothetical protein n=1 Tax=[Roseibacterium] beibuensis TaxID=1193142 RepID=UPI00217E821A|nr:hypothetical protein [Roseibacterium beibuensis]MCS6623233.1 hypothetical protein [Roseibacterium beibuensis]
MLAALAACFTLAVGVPAEADRVTFNRDYVIVASGNGGSVIDYARRASQVRATGATVQFSGRCQSACTLYLSAPRQNVCLMPGASFTFHAAYGSNPDFNRWATNYMLDRYPSWVQAWIAAHGGLSRRLLRMDYSYASRFIPTCEGRRYAAADIRG